MAKAERRERKDGTPTWRVRFRLGGKPRALTIFDEDVAEHFAELVTHSGARTALAWLDDQEDAPSDPFALTLDEYAAEWLNNHLSATEGTLQTYRRMYERRWSPLLGMTRVDQITRATVQQAIKKLPANWSDKTLRNHHTMLAAVLERAVDDGIIGANPAKGFKLPRRTSHEETEMRFLTHAEFALLVNALPEYARPVVMMLGGTGMRWGEAEALTVADVDLDPNNPVVRITKAVKWDPSKATRDIGPTKTVKSKRTIILPPETTEAVEPLTEGRKASERLFLAPMGGPLRHRTFYDVWKRACEKSGLEPQPRIHDLRHSHVAWLIAAGTPLPVIQARLGHSTITTTIDRYGHLLPDLQRQAADAASAALAGVRLTAGPETPAIEG